MKRGERYQVFDNLRQAWRVATVVNVYFDSSFPYTGFDRGGLCRLLIDVIFDDTGRFSRGHFLRGIGPYMGMQLA